MSAVTHAGTQPYYFVPAPSRHPAMAALGMLLVIFGASQWINGSSWASWVLLVGFAFWVFVLQQWFRDAVRESEGGLYGSRIDVSYRWSMSWFIFSEVMFFGVLGALYGPRPRCLRSGTSRTPSSARFQAVWPARLPATPRPAGIAAVRHLGRADPTITRDPWTSGVTVTIAITR